jgi:hypothetical protein
MVSSEKESFAFQTVCQTEGAVESWLGVVEKEMKDTLHSIHKAAVFGYAPRDARLHF